MIGEISFSGELFSIRAVRWEYFGNRMQFVKEEDETRWRNASDKVWIKGFVAQEDVVAANRR